MTQAGSSPFRRSSFVALFGAQLTSALNDNFLKNAIVVGISASQASLFGISPKAMINLCSALFIVPFFLLSAWAGQLSDRYDKTRVFRIVKAAEVAIMALAAWAFVAGSLPALLAALFAMGVHS